jgi:hypothetical protein
LSDVTRILESIEHGDPKAADELLPLTTPPVLNLKNLRNQVTLLPSLGNTLHRLTD